MTQVGHTAIVAHDAGAANHIIAWLAGGHLPDNHYALCLQGPAASIYKTQIGDFEYRDYKDAMTGASCLLSGSGWSSDLEHNARGYAANNTIHSIAVLDHWVNYPDRFIRNQNTILPDALWVTDQYAYSLASQQFSDIVVQQRHNAFLERQLKEIKQQQKSRSPAADSTCLFLMEPIRLPWNRSEKPGEIEALDYFLNHYRALKLQDFKRIIIRPHPSDPSGKYQPYLTHYYSAIDIDVNESDSLSTLMASADIIVGCQSYAMVIGLALGKTVVSALPDYAPPCPLPHKNIVCLAHCVASGTA
ncbi:MAG: hypothetical protein AAFZ92_04795 [Pseudomonadota bacterium]